MGLSSCPSTGDVRLRGGLVLELRDGEAGVRCGRSGSRPERCERRHEHEPVFGVGVAAIFLGLFITLELDDEAVISERLP
jgi:hypothetical protein